MPHLHVSELIPAPRLEVFEYLTDPKIQPELLAPTIAAELMSPDVPLKRGCEFHYTMTRMGLAQSVRLHIEDMVKGVRLVYRQSEGLFKLWNHTLRFEEHSPRATLVVDAVDYELPFGILGLLADDLWVKRDMTRVLSERLNKAREHFSGLAKVKAESEAEL